MRFVTLCFLFSLVASQAFGQVPAPLESGASLDGADALTNNAAMLGFEHGFELSYRHIFGADHRTNNDAFMLGWSPLSLLTFGAALEYDRLRLGESLVVPTLAVAVRPLAGLSFTLAGREYIAHHGSRADLDVGVGARPTRWLSLGATIQSVTSTGAEDRSGPRTYVLSAAVRPFRSDVAALGIDARLQENVQPREWPHPRLTLDLQPLSWLGLHGAVAVNGDLFFGLSLRERHVEIGGGMGLTNGDTISGGYLYGRIRSVAGDGLNFAGRTTVEMGLSGDLRPQGELAWLDFGTRTPFGEILLELRALQDRTDVSGVRIVMQSPSVGYATLHDVRDALQALRLKGKRVTVELGDASDKDLYLASVADEVVGQPQGTINLNGVKMTLSFFKNTLDKLGAKVEAFTSGPFKNSPDSYTRAEPRPEQLQAQGALVDQLYDSLVHAIASGRHLPREKVEAMFDQTVFSGAAAQRAGLVDTLAWPLDPTARPPGGRYSQLSEAGHTAIDDRGWSTPPAIALVSVNGLIMGGESFEDPFGLLSLAGASTVVRALEAARQDDNVKAVVMRVDSPGGDILASDFIWQEARRFKGVKPLVVSMGDVAASGAYYFSLPADVIFAQPETITGSIGVFNYKIDLDGLYDKLGITHTIIKRGPHADMLDSTRPLAPDEQKILQDYVMELYRDFLDKVAAARHMDREAAHKVAQGRVWSGAQAMEHGLVDRMGGLLDAIAEAKKLAGLSETAAVMVQPYPAQGAPYQRFGTEMQSSLGLAQAASGLGGAAAMVSNYVSAFSRLLREFHGRSMYLFPYTADSD